MLKRKQAFQHPWRTALFAVLSCMLAVFLLSGCNSNNDDKKESKQNTNANTNSNTNSEGVTAAQATKTTVYYEIFPRSFNDSNGDGIGDLNGITAKLDYLNDGNPKTNTDLGVGGIWLMPIQATPSYHGYDVSDYYKINPDYGTIDDLKKLISEAHKRGIKVITDLVVNHTSTEHPWFIDSAKGKNSPYRNWYLWAKDQKRDPSETSAANGDAAWHPLNGDYYMGTFWEGMPDLNFDNPDVRKEMIKIGKFWLDTGLDGFRLDAAKHIYEDTVKDGSNPKTVEKNVAWWQEFRKGLQEVKPDIYLVGEIWNNSPAVLAPYLNNALDSTLNFGLGDKIVKAVRQEKDNSVAFTLERGRELYAKTSGGKYIDAPFLTNHDQNRVMSELNGNVDQMKMAASLLLTMPGNPFIYYGEEIGMEGKKPDENIREPLPWGAPADKVAGTTTWEVAQINTGEKVNVAAEEKDKNSLLSLYKKLIRWRSQEPALADGEISSFNTGVEATIAYVRKTADEQVLVIHNLSGKEQTVKLAKDDAGSFKKIELETKKGSKLSGKQNADRKLKLAPYSTVVLK